MVTISESENRKEKKKKRVTHLAHRTDGGLERFDRRVESSAQPPWVACMCVTMCGREVGPENNVRRCVEENKRWRISTLLRGVKATVQGAHTYSFETLPASAGNDVTCSAPNTLSKHFPSRTPSSLGASTATAAGSGSGVASVEVTVVTTPDAAALVTVVVMVGIT